MPDKDLRKLGRSELLELLVKLSEENEKLTAECATLHHQLEDKALRIQDAGSIAEAALRVNGIFEDAQKAAEQYIENVRSLNESAQADADALKMQTERTCAELESAARQSTQKQLAETGHRCEEMLAKAQREVQAQWATLETRLDAYCQAHEGLKEQLGSLHFTQK